MLLSCIYTNCSVIMSKIDQNEIQKRLSCNFLIILDHSALYSEKYGTVHYIWNIIYREGTNNPYPNQRSLSRNGQLYSIFDHEYEKTNTWTFQICHTISVSIRRTNLWHFSKKAVFVSFKKWISPGLHRSPNGPSKNLKNMLKLLNYMKYSLIDSAWLVYHDQSNMDSTKVI